MTAASAAPHINEAAPVPRYWLPGRPQDAGYAHGRAITELLAPAFADRYIARVARANRVDRAALDAQAARWMEHLPEPYRLEIDAMAAGARVPADGVAQFLYADIAGPSSPYAARPDAGDPPGPMCSAIAHRIRDGLLVARNCDWLPATLSRATAAVGHARPGHLPVLAVGIRGDIDIDTGLNAAGLWLHLHTMHATDAPALARPGGGPRPLISWLFWGRYALETCETLDDVDRLLAKTRRDRGVMVVAAHGPSRTAAVFECHHASHERRDLEPGDAPCLLATNHPWHKHPDRARAMRSKTGATIARAERLKEASGGLNDATTPEHLQHILADARVEMRADPATPDRPLRTIYSSVCDIASGELRFASGREDPERPAASGGVFERVELPWG
ncbi:MAG: C45 family peptidase [Planctomycetota bacterium]